MYQWMPLTALLLLATADGLTTRLDDGWKLCPANTSITAKQASLTGFRPEEHQCINAVVPGTVLTSMLDDGGFFPEVSDPYVDEQLRLIPDINTTGKQFWTRTYQRQIAWPDGDDRVWLHLRGISYFAQVYVNGQPMSPVQAPNTTRLQGMYHRWSFDLGRRPTAESVPLTVAIRVEPPEFPGAVCVPCAGPDPCGSCGQGGDHQIAKNAAMMQFTAGWDWIQATPDRNTGLWDIVTLELTEDVVIRDPWVRTLNARQQPSGDQAAVSSSATLLNRGPRSVTGLLCMSLLSGEDIPQSCTHTTLPPASETEISLGNLTLDNITLWWPHTHGTGPKLYPAHFTFTSDDEHQSASLLAETTVRVGLRTVHASVDSTTQGWQFTVNGRRIFLEGGNWIATDQLLRFTGSAQRYYDEVMMHKQMGLNIIRVWGGGLTERPEFYDAADELGVLVMQEFWMSGDNNGRWAGSFDWPSDHSVYLSSARDMVRMLRPHPSLLFWCGGNELFPVDQQVPHTNPAPGSPGLQMALLDKLEEIVQQEDTGRFFIRSSMSNFTDFDPNFALAPKDGNYGVNEPASYFVRNPGLAFPNKSKMDQLPIAFQPEIGSVSSPVVESMRRFMSSEVLDAFPHRNISNPSEEIVHPTWLYHNYESFTTSDNVDHLCRFGIPADITEYCCHAQIAQLFQYQALFEGFQAQAFRWYNAIIFWKSQSPWPAMRGAFYDHYLDTTGGFWGVRKAASEQVHLQLNQLTRSLAVINKRFEAVEGATVIASWYRLHDGSQAGADRITSGLHIAANGVTDLPMSAAPQWPDGCTDILLLRLQLTAGATLSVNEYWLPPPTSAAEQEQAWAHMRQLKNRSVALAIKASASQQAADGAPIVVTVELGRGAVGSIALMARLKLVNGSAANGVDNRLLPTWLSDNYLSLLPDEHKTIEINCCAGMRLSNYTQLAVELDGWNLQPVVATVK